MKYSDGIKAEVEKLEEDATRRDYRDGIERQNYPETETKWV